MAQYQITLDSATLHQLFLGGAGESGLSRILCKLKPNMSGDSIAIQNHQLV